MLKPHVIILAALCAGFVSCESSARDRGPNLDSVKTTAYTHSEADHLKYRTASAVGTKLKYGETRSAAADWSVYPVGTVFKIDGDSHKYEVDDYGSALVGTQTIDLYKPDKASMKQWGARNVAITVLKWGSTARSLAILKEREKKAPHIAQMVREIQHKSSTG
jgi:3D (Asp-Asp-Asp) domain-containing protein